MTAATMNRCSTWRWKPSVTKRLARSQAAARQQGRYLGLAVACYVEGPASVPMRGPRFRCNPTARSVSPPASAPRARTFHRPGQIAADQLGVAVTDVDVVTGDTDQFYWGAGTFASRGAVVAGNAVNEASKVVRKKALKLASDLFECAEETSCSRRQSLDRRIPEKIRQPRRSSTLANPMRGAVQPGTNPARVDAIISARR